MGKKEEEWKKNTEKCQEDSRQKCYIDGMMGNLIGNT